MQLTASCVLVFSSAASHVQVSKWCIVFAGIGAGAIVMGMLQQYGFSCMGQRLTRRLRVLLFESMFRQVRPAALRHSAKHTAFGRFSGLRHAQCMER